MPELVKLPKFGEIPAKGNPIGLTYLFRLTPGGDRGLTFGTSQEDGVTVGKIPGYWTCPYAGTITGVVLNTDQGGYKVKFWKTQSSRSPIPEDSISSEGYAINSPDTHLDIFDMSDFRIVDVLPGDTFAVEIVSVTSPAPKDIAGNVIILKAEDDQG